MGLFYFYCLVWILNFSNSPQEFDRKHFLVGFHHLYMCTPDETLCPQILVYFWVNNKKRKVNSFFPSSYYEFEPRILGFLVFKVSVQQMFKSILCENFVFRASSINTIYNTFIFSQCFHFIIHFTPNDMMFLQLQALRWTNPGEKTDENFHL